jgi:hypothetical protein
VNTIPDSKIVIRSDFCSGNLSRACRGREKNQFDLWVAQDSEPHIKNVDYYKTWFYFSITGVPQGEQLTFTFRNLHNQVSFLNRFKVSAEQIVQLGSETSISCFANLVKKMEATHFKTDLLVLIKS